MGFFSYQCARTKRAGLSSLDRNFRGAIAPLAPVVDIHNIYSLHRNIQQSMEMYKTNNNNKYIIHMYTSQYTLQGDGHLCYLWG